MKNTISNDDFLRFLGLVTLMAEQIRTERDLEQAAASLFGIEPEEFFRTHVYDALRGNRSPAHAMQLMGIDVAPPRVTFAAGDVVRTKATDEQPAGQPMTIKNVCAYDLATNQIGVLCTWFSDLVDGERRRVFAPSDLEHTIAIAESRDA